MALSENVDATYADRSPGDKQHQQDHDVIHAAVNAIGQPGGAVSSGLFDAKGDLLVGGADNMPVRQPVGADGALFLPDSLQGSGWRFSSARWLEGEGFPSGDAPIGSVYVDTLGTSGAVRWCMTPNGWQVEYGDTGARDMQGLLLNGWSNYSPTIPITLTRRQRTVTLSASSLSLDGTNATDNRLLTLPAGFRLPLAGNYGALGVLWGSAGPYAVSKSFNDVGVTARERVTGVISWPTFDPWPAALPGSPT